MAGLPQAGRHYRRLPVVALCSVPRLEHPDATCSITAIGDNCNGADRSVGTLRVHQNGPPSSGNAGTSEIDIARCRYTTNPSTPRRSIHPPSSAPVTVAFHIPPGRHAVLCALDAAVHPQLAATLVPGIREPGGIAGAEVHFVGTDRITGAAWTRWTSATPGPRPAGCPVADAQHQDRVLSDIALLLPEVRWAPLDNRVFEC